MNHNETRLFMSTPTMFMTAPATLTGYNKLNTCRKADPRFHGKDIRSGSFPPATVKLETVPLASLNDTPEGKLALSCVERRSYGDEIVQFVRSDYTVEAKEENGMVRGFVTDAESAETTEYSINETDELVIVIGTAYSPVTTGDEQSLDLVKRMIHKLRRNVKRRA